MADEKIAYEKFFPAVPLVGTAIAVCFDVGYFYGVGIDYFTLFSLTEHISFALEALPLALALSIALILLDALTEGNLNRIEARREIKARELTRVEEIRYLKRRLVVNRIVTFVLIFGMLAYFWYEKNFRLFALTCVGAILIMTRMAARHRWYSSGTVALLVVGSTASVLLGEFAGVLYVGRATPFDSIVLKSGEIIPANIIRAGERGLLYAKLEPKVIEFIPWEPIKSISRGHSKSLFGN